MKWLGYLAAFAALYVMYAVTEPKRVIDSAIEDVDGDGSKDSLAVIVEQTWDPKESVVLYKGPNFSEDTKVLEIPGAPAKTRLTDYDGDGKKDVVFARYMVTFRSEIFNDGEFQLFVSCNDGKGKFEKPRLFSRCEKLPEYF